MGYRAVVFDLGGVVVDSPLLAIRRYEREQGIPAGFVGRLIVDRGPEGAWSRLERGELALPAFYAAFEAECAGAGQTLSARAMMGAILEAAQPRPVVLRAIARIRERGLRVGALTNNFEVEDQRADFAHPLRSHFDVFIESRVVGLRKPDPRIYELVCRELGVAPAEAVFLDDIGANLKSARALGMYTIKVEDPTRALAELAEVLAFVLAP